MNTAQEVAFVDTLTASQRDVLLAIVLRDGDRMIGTSGLHDMDFRSRRATFGMLIGDDVDGAYVDTVVMGILRSE